MEARVPFDEESDNGLLLNGEHLPEELIAEILCYVDCDSLLNCQLVCVRWKVLMETYVWRKKAEAAFHRSLQCVKDVDWSVYYAICKRQPFEKNLIKNCSGQEDIKNSWKILRQGGHGWIVECPPAGVPPLPPGAWPDFPNSERCFATSFEVCNKEQTINLSSEGLSSHLLDTLQPPIVVSEWYCCRFDCEALYELSVKLIGDHNKIIDKFEFRAAMSGEARSKWHYISHVFTNYGKGLKKIMFRHAGIDQRFWAGHYGSKMTCATVKVKLLKEREPVPDTSCLPIEEPQILPMEPRSLADCRFIGRRFQ